MEVSFDASKTDMHKIEMAIAKSGHDTEMHKATAEAYTNLPGCCQYSRDGEAKGECKEVHPDMDMKK